MKKVSPNRLLFYAYILLSNIPYLGFLLIRRENIKFLLIAPIVAGLLMSFGYKTFYYDDSKLCIGYTIWGPKIFQQVFYIHLIRKITIKELGGREDPRIIIDYDGKIFWYTFRMWSNEKGFREMLNLLKLRVPELEILGAVWR